MTPFHPIREVPQRQQFSAKDTLVVFGELFQRGYANGVVDEAHRAGMNIIYTTVGRRNPDGTLRPLTPEELAEKGVDLINVPLEAGFDLEKDENGQSPVDQLKQYGLTGWEDAKLDWDSIHQCQRKGRQRFVQHTREFVSQLIKQIDPKGKIVFLHTMAGGFPRAKVVMPIANKVFKGSGDRFLSSKVFWDGDIGRLCDLSFNEVTADTFSVLIDETRSLREQSQKAGGSVSYMAFGYHGNEVMVGQEYRWFSYSPYLQGWAKLRLENHAATAFEKGIQASVFNVPEILTNSSSIFLGIEVVLYPLLRSLRNRFPDHPLTNELLQKCTAKLKDGHEFQQVDQITQDYLRNPKVMNYPSFNSWPQHNSPEQAELMKMASTAIIDMHKDKKDLLTSDLSEVIFKACGYVMLAHSGGFKKPVSWIGHDLVTEVAGRFLD